MHGRGTCVAGGMHDKGACMAGGVYGRELCVAGWGVAWQERWPLQSTVRILLECILVSNVILIIMQIVVNVKRTLTSFKYL